MYNFTIRKTHTSEKLLIAFQAQPDDRAFQIAIRDALEPAGFMVKNTDHGVWASYPDPIHPLGAVSIDSDEWCTFGEADSWGVDQERNVQGIGQLARLLLSSGGFVQAPSLAKAQPGA